MKKELWQKIIHFAITILMAIATTLGTTSCIGLMQCPHTPHTEKQCRNIPRGHSGI
ncbi:MAG: smalltalk protein [Bacteroidaceae bacterium]|nr:smalltalk protein [Bacteroidaceae bacterium]